jgi:hypothetical protein
MKRTFATPAALKASLEDRLRARSRATGADLQRLRQLVVYDRSSRASSTSTPATWC